MIQLDIKKAYDHVSWSFLAQLMSKMGFGTRMSGLTFMFCLSAVSYILLNDGVTKAIPLTRSVRQRCPLSPLLFVIVTHPNLVKNA